MVKILSVALLCFLFFTARSQNSNVQLAVKSSNSTFKESQPYGKVDMEDLELKKCDFEPDANAEVLFDVGSLTSNGEILLHRHRRIKIFNDAGKNYASVRLEYFSFMNASIIRDLQAETINVENGKITFTLLDSKSAYSEKIDRFRSALVFAFPNVKAGSILEFKYVNAFSPGNYMSAWNFQTTIPTRYSEIKTDFPGGLMFRVIPHVRQSYAKNIGSGSDYTQVKALVNVRALTHEPYAGALADNFQRMEYLFISRFFSDWSTIGELFLKFDDVGQQYDKSIPGENIILKKAKTFKTDDEKIAFIFDTVKTVMKWNDISTFYTIDGAVTAWNKKTGNSTEINLILYNLLKRAKVKVYPMLISTRDNGKLNPLNPNPYIFNSTVVFYQADTSKYYVLDATNKYNLFNTIPTKLLNTFALNIDEGQVSSLQETSKSFQTIFLQNIDPVNQTYFLNAEIQPNGILKGTTEINSYYNQKTNALGKYDTLGKEKFIKAIALNDNNIKISDFKLEGADVDSIPLTQKFNFETELTGSDEKYIILNTDIFSFMGPNPFIKEERFTDIDFGFRENYALNSIYKIPPGFKTDSLPKSLTILTPDEGIVFKRTVAEDNGMILIKYSLNHRKTIYFREEYPDIKSFYKKIYELAGEQIVLKKIN